MKEHTFLTWHEGITILETLHLFLQLKNDGLDWHVSAFETLRFQFHTQ